jgi:hypothetical protein
MAGQRNIPGSKTAPSALGAQSALRKGADGSYVIEQPRSTAPGTSYWDDVFKQIFDTKTPKRAQKTRKLNEKGEWVAGGSEDVLRNRPDFILQSMLSADPKARSLIKQFWDKSSAEQKKILAQEIAESFPDAQNQAPGGSPMYREVMSFLRTGELSPERIEVLRQEAELANSDPRVQRESRALAPGVSDRAVSEDMDNLDTDIQFDPDTVAPGDIVLNGGPRAFQPPEGVDTTYLRTDLDARPYLRTQESVSVRGDKINPKNERFTTGMIEGEIEPTPEEIAAHRTAWMRGEVAKLAPDHPRLNELTPAFMEQVLTSRGIAIEPGLPPARRQMPVRVPQAGGTVGPQDAGRILAGEKYEAADAARVARMEQALANEFGMNVSDIREQFRMLQQAGDEDGLKQMQARAKIAIRSADLGPRPQVPYDSATKESDLRAASSVAEGGEQRQLVDALDQLGRGQLGAEDRLFRMLVLKSARDKISSPIQAGIPNAEAMADYALSLVRNPDVLGRIRSNQGFETWRQQLIEALDNRFYRQDQPPRVMTREEAAIADAANDAEAPFETLLDENGVPQFVEAGYRPDVPREVTPEQMDEYQARREAFERATGRGSGYLATVLSDVLDPRSGQRVSIDSGTVPFMQIPSLPRVAPQPTPLIPGGNVGGAGVPRRRGDSQADGDAYPYGIDQYGRPVSAVPGFNPTAGRKSAGHVNSPADRYPGSEGIENLSDAAENIGTRRVTGVPISPDPDAGIMTVQASALENSIGYANQRGKVVWQDPTTGEIFAAYITPKMKPEKVAEIRENARALAASSGSVFDYYWPDGGLPRPDFHRWNLGDAPDAVPEGYVPPSATAPPRDMSPVEPMPPATPRRYADVPTSTLKQAESEAQALEASMTEGGPLPPGVRVGLDGRLYKTAFDKPGFFADDVDPNDLLNDASVLDDAAPSGNPATLSRQQPDDSGAEAWGQQGRTILDADGNELPQGAASAEDYAREVASILSNPDASDEDLKFAMEVGRGLQDYYNTIPDEGIKAQYRENVLAQIEAAAAARNKPAQPADDIDPADDIPPNDEQSEALAIDTAPATAVDPVEQDLAAAATPVDPDPQPALTREQIEKIAADAGYVYDPTTGRYVKPGDQPSAQSADNQDPQDPAKPVEAESVVNADAQKQVSDAEADAARIQAEKDAAAREAADEQQAVDEATGATPDPKKSYGTRIKEHFQKNWGKYGIAGGIGAVGLSMYHSGVTSDPYPDAMPMGPGPEQDSMEEISPEDRIRLMMRSRSGSRQGTSPYPVQTPWRQY